MDASALADYVDATDFEFVNNCWDQAKDLVDAYIGDVFIPSTIYGRAILEVGAELYNRREAPGGIMQFADLTGGQGVRVARNPMVAAYPLLNHFVGGGIG